MIIRGKKSSFVYEQTYIYTDFSYLLRYSLDPCWLEAPFIYINQDILPAILNMINELILIAHFEDIYAGRKWSATLAVCEHSESAVLV